MTALKSIRNRPALSVLADGAAVWLSVMDLTIAEYGEANLTRSSVIFTCVQNGQSDELIALLEVNDLNLSTCL